MKITTKRGDKGYTSLLSPVRVPKYDLRPDTYGTIDEANSALGLARALAKKERTKEIVCQIQKELFVVGAELATSSEDFEGLARQIVEKDTQRLENLMNNLEEEIDLPQSFVIPGATPSSAALDLARTIIRRAERKVVNLKDKTLMTNEEIIKYLNRLSDLLFTLARYEEGGEYELFQLRDVNGITKEWVKFADF